MVALAHADGEQPHRDQGDDREDDDHRDRARRHRAQGVDGRVLPGGRVPQPETDHEQPARCGDHREGRELEGFFVRKQQKEHGAKERVEGVLKPGMRVAVLDDVLTTGGSVLQAIEEIEKIGAIVVAVVCIVDRLEGARQALAKYQFLPIFTIRDFGVQPA